MELPLPSPVLAEVQVSQIWNRFGLNATFRDTPWWGWVALAGMIFIGLASAKVITYIFGTAARTAAERRWARRSILFASFGRPLGLAAFTMAAMIGIGFLKLQDDLRWFAWQLGKLLIITAGGWLLYNLVDIVEALLRQVTARTRSPLDDQLVPLVRKTLRILLVVMLGLFVADNVFQADIRSFLAGLGIVGLALSLASQDTVKNFFGSVTIFVDQPFNLGDRIILTGHDGVVEEIGFRSTKLRTAAGHVVQIPNSKIVDSTVENVTRRPFTRRTFDVPLAPGLSIERIERAVAVVNEVLGDPEIAAAFDPATHPPRAALEDLPPPGGRATIRVNYWFRPAADVWAYQQHAQKLNLLLLRRLEVEKLG